MPSNSSISNPYIRKQRNPTHHSAPFRPNTSARASVEDDSSSLSLAKHSEAAPSLPVSPSLVPCDQLRQAPSTLGSNVPNSTPSSPHEGISGSRSAPLSVGSMESIEGDDSYSQVPAVAKSAYVVAPAPQTGSPSTEDIRADLEGVRANRMNDGWCLVDELSKNYKKQKKRIFPNKEICSFFREPLVSKRFAQFSLTSTPSTPSRLRDCMRNWNSSKRQIKKGDLDVIGDETVQCLLTDGGVALGHNFGRMWLEDFMVLNDGDVLTMLVSPDHRFFRGKGKREMLSRGLSVDILESMMLLNPLRPVVIGKKCYFAIRIKVKSNAYYNDFVRGTLDRNDASRLLKLETGAGVTFVAHGLGRKGEIVKHVFTIFFQCVLVDPLEVMFWKEDLQVGTRISSFKRTLDKMNDHVRMHALVDVYKDYVFGDRLQYYALFSHLATRLLKKQKEVEISNYKNATISDVRFQKHLCLSQGDESMKTFVSKIDRVCRAAIDNLYGKFSTYATPILSQRVLNEFVTDFKEMLPTQYKAITFLIGKESGHNRVLKNKWLWDRYATYIFFVMLRIRNMRNLTWWSMINAAGEYGHSVNASKIPLFFGFSSSRRTLLRNLSKVCPIKDITKRTIATLSPIRFTVGIFDNSQIFSERKFQRGGRSSHATIVTARMFIKAMMPTYFGDRFSHRPEIKYVGQCIPSPYGMPKFEELAEIDRTVFTDEKWITNHSSIDASGNRVKTYAEVVFVAHTLARFVHLLPFWLPEFEFSNEDHNETLQQLQIVRRLKPLTRKKPILLKTCNANDNSGGLIRNMVDFQWKCTLTWRNSGHITPASALIPPVNPDDETTNIGAAQNVVSLLLLRGILECTENDAVDDAAINVDVTKVKLAEGYERKWLMLVGDGLTQMRVKTFSDLVQQSSYSFGEQQKTFEVLRHALGQVVHVTGDLHGGQFHFLSAIYTLFYPCLIQPVQELVAWKRICGTDVTKCYQQAAGLVMMIGTELERNLIPLYIHDKASDPEVRERMLYIRNQDGEQEQKNQENFAVDLAKGFHDWTKTKRASTSDDVFKMSLNFVELVRYYREFKLALSCGDAVMIEHLYKVFLPIFGYTGKKHYVEIVCSMMEQFYSKIDGEILQLVRINRTMPLYTGRDTTGRRMSDWALDSMIEVMNQQYTKMNFHNDLDGWRRHSAHVQMHNKSCRFIQSEYSRVWTDEGKALKSGGGESVDIGIDANKRQSAKPSRRDEKVIIAEYIQACGLCNEVQGRTYNRKRMYEAMKNVKTKFGNELAEQKSRWLDEAMTEQERQLSGVIQQLFSTNSDHTSAQSETNRSHVEMDFNTISFLDTDAEESNPDDAEEEHNEEHEDNEEHEGNDDITGFEEESSSVFERDGILTAEVGNGRKVKLRPMKLNMKAFRDVVESSHAEMMSKRLHVCRYRKSQRMERERKRNKRILDRLQDVTNNAVNSTSSLLVQGISRLERRVHYRPAETTTNQNCLNNQTRRRSYIRRRTSVQQVNFQTNNGTELNSNVSENTSSGNTVSTTTSRPIAVSDSTSSISSLPSQSTHVQNQNGRRSIRRSWVEMNTHDENTS